MEIANNEVRLKRFYGDVAKMQNSAIINMITGKRILDIGCGYGSLIKQIKEELPDSEVIGIDTDIESANIAKNLYDIDVKSVSAYGMDFSDDSFDTVILRETVHHFDTEAKLDKALAEIKRVCSKELIVFDPNPNWLVKFSRRLIRHKDPEAPLDRLLEKLENAGFKVEKYKWRDVIAFPLSGGFVGKEFVPNLARLKKTIIMIDEGLNRFFERIRLQRHICWRYLVYATKKEKKTKG